MIQETIIHHFKPKIAMSKRTKNWNATIMEEDFIRENYGKMSKTQMANHFGISVKQFAKYVQQRGIVPIYEQSHIKRDFTGYVRIAVPCKYNNATYVLVKPDRVEKVRKKYKVQDHIRPVAV